MHAICRHPTIIVVTQLIMRPTEINRCQPSTDDTNLRLTFFTLSNRERRVHGINIMQLDGREANYNIESIMKMHNHIAIMVIDRETTKAKNYNENSHQLNSQPQSTTPKQHIHKTRTNLRTCIYEKTRSQCKPALGQPYPTVKTQATAQRLICIHLKKPNTTQNKTNE